MSYKYDFDHTAFGQREFETAAYQLIQEGLRQLLAEIDKWNAKAEESGAEPPYEVERGYLANTITWGDTQLARTGHPVRLDISVGTARYLRAGLELILRRKRNELEKNRIEGWPSAVLESLQRSLEELEQVASALDVPRADILWEVLPEGEAGTIVVQMRSEGDTVQWDAFISHASDDKDAFVRPLAEALDAAGLHIWYDDFSLRMPHLVGARTRKNAPRSPVRFRVFGDHPS